VFNFILSDVEAQEWLPTR